MLVNKNAAKGKLLVFTGSGHVISPSVVPNLMGPERQTKTTLTGSPVFPTTLWTEVRRAAHDDGTEARESLEKLCRAYWYPLYAFARRSGNSHDDAQELTQGYFEYLLDHRLLARADQIRGRFRSYLLVSFKSFVRDEWRKEHAHKRGGGAAVFSLDAHDTEEADTRYRFEPTDKFDADKIYERDWALTLLARALDHLEAEFKAAGKSDRFEAMQPFLKPGCGDAAYADLAGKLALTVEAARVAVHRLHRRYRELLREEVAQTVDPAEVDDELQNIRRALAS